MFMTKEPHHNTHKQI